MKRRILSFLFLAGLTLSTLAQAPEGFNYQAVVRDAGNAILANQAVGVQIAILQGSATGTAVYTETFSATTNAYGLINLPIGTGTTVDNFSTIDWSVGPYFIETSIDVTGGTTYSVMGTSQLMSVPYALFAKTSGASVNSPWQTSGTDIYNSNTGNVGVGISTPAYKLSVGSPDSTGNIALGHYGAFNDVHSGEIRFEEDLNYGSQCGLKFQMNGSTNNLHLIGGCPTPDTIARFNRSGSSNLQNLRIGTSILSNATSTLTVDGDIQVNGNVNITGNISKGGGTFKIDHPLDPTNKYLIHSFVESPDMLNIYSGNVTTDANGYATVTMPDYFEAANKDFRYQLTVIGTFAQAIVKEKISNNTFVIQTNQPNVEVSWSVTGVRNDRYAVENRIEPEAEKEIKGTYIHPELYGASPAESEEAAKLKMMNKEAVPTGNDGQ